MPEIRIGLGKDLHRLVKGRPLVLGGVTIPFPRGEAGHSDGDVLTHALIDALLGAAALGDIGLLFPPSDPAWKDACSLDLLRIAAARVAGGGWRIINIDAVIECEAPKIAPYNDAIRAKLAGILALPPERLFIKGKTGEGIGLIGKGRAIAATAVCLLTKEE